MTGPAAGNQIPQDGTQADTGDDRGIGIGADGGVDRFGAGGRAFPGTGVALFDSTREALAGLGDVVTGDICRGREQRLGVFGELVKVVTDGLGGFRERL